MITNILSVLASALMAMPGVGGYPAMEVVPVMAHNVAVVEEAPAREFRGVWVTTVINLDFPSQPGLSNADMKREIDYIVEHSRSVGLNAIILQVRPAGDAIYPSSLFPWSKYVTGEQGLPPADGFDPLAYWIEQAHANGLELHAWINPFRVTHSTSRITDVNLLHPTNPARMRPDLVMAHGNALYLDPGFPDSRQLIFDGVVELLTNYALDGIHLDDYFYPGRDFDDAASFAIYGMGMDHTQWRVNNINSLIYGLQQTINEINPDVKLGISPTGIWANSATHPLGSDTRGYQHYFELSADSRRWVQEGWIDYIVPQIYWHIGFEIAEYETLLRWWEDLVRGTDVELHIGHAAWREQEGQANFSGEMLRQMQMNAESDVVAGSVFFRWASLQGPVGETLRHWYAAKPQNMNRAIPRQPVLLMDELFVAIPSRDVTVAGGATGHTIAGSSIPGLPLFMNGEPVTNRTPEGFFGVFVPITNGTNTFEFTQPGQPTAVRHITRNAPAPPAGPDSIPTPPTTPQTPPAPPATREYTEPYYATITSEVAWMYPGATVTGGTNWMLERGMRDRITASALDGRWLRLSNGGWIDSNHVERVRSEALTENNLRNGSFSRDGHIETISWQINGSGSAAARAVFEENRLTVYFGMQTEPPHMRTTRPPAGSLFASMHSGVTDNGIAYITLTPQEDIRINGYDIRIENNRLILTVMTPRPLYPSWRTPFNGFTFVIDAGHGGSDYGAIGPMGPRMAEKHINLINSIKLAERLEEMGANVILVRDEDTEHTLIERVKVSRAARPDMFISMHANSVDETTDSTSIRGFTVWYRNETSHYLARTIMDHMHAVNPGTNRWANPNQANFHVCRPTWAPSILLETSFMPNIDDFAWMISPAYQDRLAEETVLALIGYYNR
ncbi:MAG: family 10 glycosylhydrolase [Defluviitaleaceae bacterium]|nr:family 10 glycosylhydrolase [Defluviitaleaceae bacterium]